VVVVEWASLRVGAHQSWDSLEGLGLGKEDEVAADAAVVGIA